MDEIIQSILDENDLVVKQIPEGPFSLMRAISNCLYFTSINYKQIQEQCIRFLQQMIDQKKLPEKLNQFKNSITLYNDFILDPNKFDYHKVNLELVSLLFQTKIQVYYINEENQLLSFIINNRYKRKIEMIYTNNHYDPIFSRKFIQLITISQSIVQKIIDQSLEVNGKAQDKFINYEYENWLLDRIMQLNEMNSMTQINQCDSNGTQQYTRFKRSLSDNYNVNYGTQQDIYQEENQIPKQSGIIEESDESSNQNDNNIQAGHNQFQKTNNEHQKKKQQGYQENEYFEQNKFESNLYREKADSLITPKLDISQVQTLDKRPIISPIYFVKSNPPGISPKPNLNTNVQKFEWKNQDDSNEDSIIEERSNGNEMSAQSSLNTSSQGPSSKRGSGKFNAANITGNSPTKLKSEKDAPLSQFAQKKPKIVEMGQEKVTGSLKFFDEKKNFGFFVLDSDGSDIFVYYDDLEQAGITKKMLKESVEKKTKLYFKFNCMSYVGKYQNSKKAVDIELIGSFQTEESEAAKQETDDNLEEQTKQSNLLEGLVNQSSTENQQITSEQKKKQLSERFAGFSSIIAASQNTKS
ncbi:cold-shock protein, putative (macronuclear) [Tetrahymena thermophila SB210]|uniref:Cold-shock protein, putative n=1 Tax=Tetrahymena thermophila (strain SB210) TaxID=312017 RepID=Q248G5_TETTS|nr:cold-shock protein, putative [Tetrahymena thermophila SB210]EAS04080.2 cold-shock protein, putative [Tetrahymena thermophila SB210]|eukprot:XP_001024325.2 cold-shock protein, putative [Tetrahymena thermophila SB210]